eukprot:TRINITY_DN3293_c0_g1_i1.p1 TRINITY_DN3293_c0_g1~~TRINITY_DN3293_c0_g1_i1.p1  ORF type:complete len:199 (+),score=29.57 TRINITY_DN3293_c0_g1_i1:930-1526(+)
MCWPENPVCNTGVPQFVVGPEAFNLLSDDSDPNAQLLYDITARPVSCHTTGPLKIKLSNSNVYNINAFVYNTNYGIDSLSIIGNGMDVPAPFVRNLDTSSFAVQVPNTKIIPPIIITAKSVFGESLSVTILGSVVDLQIILFPSNFAGNLISANSSCPYSALIPLLMLFLLSSHLGNKVVAVHRQQGSFITKQQEEGR